MELTLLIMTSLCSLLLKIWKFGVTLAAELRILTYDLAELIDKRSIFGLDTTINR